MRPDGFRGTFRDDLTARALYAEAAGIGRALPHAVAVPGDEDDVVALVRWAHATGAPLVPRGSGSSMAGGAIGPGIIVDLSRLAAIGPVDAEARRVWVGPGALRGAVDRAARAHGLRFPVDPSSGEYCTVGGMASTNAAGAHSLRFGATRAWVTALDCVFDDGTRAVVRRGAEIPPLARRVPAVQRFAHRAMPSIFTTAIAEPVARIRHAGVRKESSGYALTDFARTGDLVDLLVGSEGTLALLVGVELALAPLPAATASLLAAFPTLEQAVRAATMAREAGASACELLDRTFLDVARQGEHAPDIPQDSEAVLLAEVESEADGGAGPGGTASAASAASASGAAAALEMLFLEAGASRVALALAPDAERALWALRHAASPILARLDPELKSMQFIEDGAVPPERLPEFVRGIREALDRHGLRGVIFGHAGDAHVHVNPLVDVREPAWRERVTAVLDEVVALTDRLGGTLAGEHGDGRLRTPLLARVWPSDATLLFELVKQSFDPAGLLNPGVKVPLLGQAPLDAVKYDPALEPLPAAAREALDRVVRERAYAEFRLAMVASEDAPGAVGTPAAERGPADEGVEFERPDAGSPVRSRTKQ